MKHQTKVNSEEQQQQVPLQQTQAQAVREFATAEELLRHDAIHTPVPPRIAHRLQESIRQNPPRAPAWWRRWFRS